MDNKLFNKKAQSKMLLFMVIVLITTVVFFKFTTDFANDITFRKIIQVNELKISKDVMDSFFGSVIYKIPINLSEFDIDFKSDHVLITGNKRYFFSPINFNKTLYKPKDLYYIKSGNQYYVSEFYDERYLNIIDYVDINTKSSREINFVNLKPENEKLEQVKERLLKVFKDKGYQVSDKAALTFILDSSSNNKVPVSVLFSFDKSEVTRIKSRKVGALVLNNLILKFNIDNAVLKPESDNTNLNNYGTSVIVRFSENFISDNLFLIPIQIENAIDKYYEG